MMKRFSCIFLLAAASATAQNLSTEITVDRTVVPAERAASRLSSVHPSIFSVPVRPANLTMTEYMEPGSVTRSSHILAPAAWADSFALSPYRGYVSGGYFPVYNLGLSAGYRILQTSDTRLGIWGQFDGYSYKERVHAADDKQTYKNNTFAAGMDFDRRFGRNGVLTAGASYSYGRVVAPGNYCAGDRGIGMADVKVAWYARAGRVGYHVDAAFRTFSASSNCDNDPLVDGFPIEHVFYKKGTESRFTASAGLITRLGSSHAQRAGLELKADMLSRPDATTVNTDGVNADKTSYWYAAPAAGSTLGVISATPYYAFGHDTGLHLRLGARVDISTGGEGKKFHIAPDVLVSYNATGFSVFARAGGGEVLNTQRSLYDYTPFFPTGWQYERSHLPLTLDAGVNIGPFAGFGLELFGGWARANDWLMPAVVSLRGTAHSLFRATDIKGAHAGVRASYAYRSLLRLSASVEFAPQKEGDGYYLWRDRAKMVVKAGATVCPVEKLELKLDYEFRDSRAAYAYTPASESISVGLGCVSDLSFGARYSITPALDVFAHGDNLLGRKYAVMPGIPSQGIHGLAGVSFKF